MISFDTHSKANLPSATFTDFEKKSNFQKPMFSIQKNPNSERILELLLFQSHSTASFIKFVIKKLQIQNRPDIRLFHLASKKKFLLRGWFSFHIIFMAQNNNNIRDIQPLEEIYNLRKGHTRNFGTPSLTTYQKLHEKAIGKIFVIRQKIQRIAVSKDIHDNVLQKFDLIFECIKHKLLENT